VDIDQVSSRTRQPSIAGVSPELQKDISEFKPTLVPNGQPMTLQLVGQVFHADSEGWDFINSCYGARSGEKTDSRAASTASLAQAVVIEFLGMYSRVQRLHISVRE